MTPHTNETAIAAAMVLNMHQRTGDGGVCMCGRLRLGRSHTEHLADMLDGAGLLREHVVKS